MQKTIFLFLIITLITLFSCSPEAALTPSTETSSSPIISGETTPVSNSPNTITSITCPEGIELHGIDIPVFILDYLATNHPNIKLDEISKLDDDGLINYGIELKDGTQLLLDASGILITQSVKNEVPIAIANLPEVITSYISDQFPNAIIKEAKQMDKYGTTYLEIELDNHSTLIFDEIGTYLCSTTEEDDNDEEEDNDDDDYFDDDDYNFDDDDDDDDDDENLNIPQETLAYINSNYPDYTNKDAELKKDCDGTTFLAIEIKHENNSSIELAFDLTGNFLYASIKLTSVSLPSNVLNSLETNYTNYQLKEKASKLTFQDGSIQYKVKMKALSGQEDLKVWIGEDGVVICDKED